MMRPLSFTSLRHLHRITKHALKLDAPVALSAVRLCTTQAVEPTKNIADLTADLETNLSLSTENVETSSLNLSLTTETSSLNEPIFIQPEHHAENFPRQPLTYGEPMGKWPQEAADKFTTPSLFNDLVINKFINALMSGGRKDIAREVLEKTFEEIKILRLKQKRKGNNPDLETDPLVIFHGAYKNAQPKMGIETKKKGGKAQSVPYPLKDSRRSFLAMKWLIESAKKRPGTKKHMQYKLSEEIVDAYNEEGGAIGKKVEMHKAAEANRAYSHFRWW